MSKTPLADLRSRAISYARNQSLNIGEMIGRGVFMQMTHDDLQTLRIAIDNVIASGFEMGYAAALDDSVPRKALRDPQPGRRKR